MQAALDSTALMLSKDLSQGLISDSDVDAKAGAYFKALYTNPEATVATPDIHGTYTAKDSSGASNIVVSGKGSIDTQFMKVAGFPQLNFNSTSTTKWGDARMRVAMALDVTGSMDDDNKMSNMQTAAKSMIDTLSKLNKITGDVYISIIPFSKDVNIGPTSDAAAWVTGWPAWEAEPALIKTNKPANWKNYGPGSDCPFKTGTQGFGCVETPVSGSDSTNTIPSSGTYSGYICPGVDSGTANYYNGCYDSKPLSTTSTITVCSGGNSCKCSAGIGGTGSSCSCSGNGNNGTKVCTETLKDYSHTWIVNNHNTWNGCVTDRDQNYDTTNDEPKLGVTATPILCRTIQLLPAGDHADEQSVEHAQDQHRQARPGRQYQPGDRSCMGLDLAEPNCAATGAHKGRRLHLQRLSCSGVRRYEHAKSLVHESDADRCPSDAALRQPQEGAL